MCRRTVFKVYGKFDWPGSGAGNAQKKPGKFLFYYADDDGVNRAAIEWTPDADNNANDDLTVPDKGIGNLTVDEEAKLKAGEPFNYWLRGKFENGKGIEITGAQVFEQIAKKMSCLCAYCWRPASSMEI